jgi:hypothetical protein
MKSVLVDVETNEFSNPLSFTLYIFLQGVKISVDISKQIKRFKKHVFMLIFFLQGV